MSNVENYLQGWMTGDLDMIQAVGAGAQNHVEVVNLPALHEHLGIVHPPRGPVRG